MIYPPAFLEIQVTFAQKVATVANVPFQDAVLHYTALYRILGLDWSLDSDHPVWQQFISALREDGSGLADAYRVYNERYAQGLIPDYDTSRTHWGCFSYEYQVDAQAIRLHFANLDTSGAGPLSSRSKEVRVAELRAMFMDIRREHPEAERVMGGSWLYNRAEYRRLFPPQFGVSARPDHPHLIARALWGQFLRHDNRMNQEVTSRFLACLANLHDAGNCATCFPYQTLIAEAPIADFYAFYAIDKQ